MLGLALYPPGATFGPRRTKDYEFVWIINGDVVWEADGVKHDAPPGSFVLVRKGMHDSFRWDPMRQTRHAYFHFSLRFRPTSLAESKWPLVVRMPDGDIIRPLFRHMASLWKQGQTRQDPLIDGAASLLLRAFLAQKVETLGEGAAELPPAVERALSFVQKQWANGRLLSPPVDDLAKAAAVSTGHLCRLFKQSVGCGPIEALRMARLDRAATILSRSNMRIQEVAHSTGFENAFHFSRCFRTVYGLSPRDFRAHMLTGGQKPTIKLVRARKMTGRLWGEF